MNDSEFAQAVREMQRVPYNQAATFICTGTGYVRDSTEVIFHDGAQRCTECGSRVAYRKVWEALSDAERERIMDAERRRVAGTWRAGD